MPAPSSLHSRHVCTGSVTRARSLCKAIAVAAIAVPACSPIVPRHRAAPEATAHTLEAAVAHARETQTRYERRAAGLHGGTTARATYSSASAAVACAVGAVERWQARRLAASAPDIVVTADRAGAELVASVDHVIAATTAALIAGEQRSATMSSSARGLGDVLGERKGLIECEREAGILRPLEAPAQITLAALCPQTTRFTVSGGLPPYRADWLTAPPPGAILLPPAPASTFGVIVDGPMPAGTPLQIVIGDASGARSTVSIISKSAPY